MSFGEKHLSNQVCASRHTTWSLQALRSVTEIPDDGKLARLLVGIERVDLPVALFNHSVGQQVIYFFSEDTTKFLAG